MSDVSEQQNLNADGVKLNGLFAFKVGMSSVYNENGEAVPVTVLKVEDSFVSQIKTEERDGYEAIQVAIKPKSAKRTPKAMMGALKGAIPDKGVYFVREIRQAGRQDIQVGQKISINSLVKGDIVSLSSRSKGRGFAGSVKRYNFAGGPAAHGSKFHRQPGSSGNRTWPGRVIPGKRWPGHYGDENITIRNVRVVDVIPEEKVILVKGSVPGASNSIVTILKKSSGK